MAAQLATVSPSTALAVIEAASFNNLSEDEQKLVKQFLVTGNFDKIAVERQEDLYIAYCRYIGVDPMERPFDLIKDRNSTKLYANSACTAALCRTRNISCKVIKKEIVNIAGFDFVMHETEATVTDGNGHTRSMTGTGVLPLCETEMKWDPEAKRKVSTGKILPLTPETIAIRWMHSETKSMRRAVLRTVGLGVSDTGDAPANSRKVEVDIRDGEIIIQQDNVPMVDPEQIEESAQELLARLADIRGATPDEVWGHVCKKLGAKPGTAMDSLSEPKKLEALETLTRWAEKAATEQRPADTSEK